MASNEVFYGVKGTSGVIEEFKRATALPERRTLASAAATGRFLYVIGGGDQLSTRSPKVFVGAIDQVTRNVLSWAEGPALPAERSFLTPSAAIVGDYLYVVGGGFTGAEKPCAEQLVLFTKIQGDGSLGAWSATTTLPKTPSGAVTASTTHLYVVGGNVPYGDSYRSQAVGSILAGKVSPDGSIASWSRVGFLADKRNQLMSAVVQGTLFAAGGRESSLVLNDVAFLKVKDDGLLVCPQ
jgi:hypothetical protein